MRPLNGDWAMEQTWADGRKTADVVAEFIKPNDRLTSFERLEIYNKQYWFRLIDVMYEDYPGVAAILGDTRFVQFCEAYLTRYPSGSGLLRDLGEHLDQFIQARPDLTAPYTAMALDVARFEWAQVVAFDAAAKPPLKPEDLVGRDPAQTRLTFQPYITLLKSDYAIDRLAIAVKKQVARSEASNATDGMVHASRRRRTARREPVALVVHRLDNSVFFKRLPPVGFAILVALQQGQTIAEAIGEAIPPDDTETDWPSQIREWFQLWMSWRWFCRK